MRGSVLDVEAGDRRVHEVLEVEQRTGPPAANQGLRPRPEERAVLVAVDVYPRPRD